MKKLLAVIIWYALIATGFSAEKPNLLFILTEDQGAQLSYIGTPGVKTPHMDALARSGVYFRNAFVSYPVCSPSKAGIYTSLHNHANGILNNTPNYHKPASQLTPAEANLPLYRNNRIREEIPTLVERLKEAGYYQGVTHKLHVAPVDKFPYDEFIPGESGRAVAGFIDRASKTGKPWHLFFNMGVSHRPFPNGDQVRIRVNPSEVKLPAFLPDTPLVRQDWAEYLAAIEKADQLIGEGLTALRDAGQEKNTIVVFMGDHGPAFPHGKMTLHDLGLRVPLAIRGPGIKDGNVSDALASALDLTPTILDLLELSPLPLTHGRSLRGVLEGSANAKGHDFIFAEISDRGVLPNDGMQERSVFDGRWHLIYREKLIPPWRQVNADSKDRRPWGNRSYDEILRVKSEFPEAFRVLSEMEPQTLRGNVPALELYDLRNDSDEMKNLATNPAHGAERKRLLAALRDWVKSTNDTSIQSLRP